MARREIDEYDALVEEAARMVKDEGQNIQDVAEQLAEETREYLVPVSILRARADIRQALKELEEKQGEE